MHEKKKKVSLFFVVYTSYLLPMDKQVLELAVWKSVVYCQMLSAVSPKSITPFWASVLPRYEAISNPGKQ